MRRRAVLRSDVGPLRRTCGRVCLQVPTRTACCVLLRWRLSGGQRRLHQQSENCLLPVRSWREMKMKGSPLLVQMSGAHNSTKPKTSGSGLGSAVLALRLLPGLVLIHGFSLPLRTEASRQQGPLKRAPDDWRPQGHAPCRRLCPAHPGDHKEPAAGAGVTSESLELRNRELTGGLQPPPGRGSGRCFLVGVAPPRPPEGSGQGSGGWGEGHVQGHRFDWFTKRHQDAF